MGHPLLSRMGLLKEPVDNNRQITEWYIGWNCSKIYHTESKNSRKDFFLLDSFYEYLARLEFWSSFKFESFYIREE